MPQSYVKRILESRVYDVARETPIDHARLLSARLGNRILLKREDLQPIFSFKLRGARNRIAHLPARLQEPPQDARELSRVDCRVSRDEGDDARGTGRGSRRGRDAARESLDELP